MNQALQEMARGSKQSVSNLTDPFLDYYAELTVAEPPASFSWLAKLYSESGPLQDCAAVMARNVGGYGIEMQAIGDRGEVSEEVLKGESDELVTRLEAISDDGTLAMLRYKQRVDLDTYGNAFMEVLRGPDGQVEGLVHAPAFTMRLAGRRTDPMPAEKYVIDAKLGWIKVEYMRRRFVFVQMPYSVSFTTGRNQIVYFKEFGDTRIVDRRTGQENENTATPATEIIWTKHYHPAYVYGLPRWLGRMAAVLSHTKAGDLNYTSLGRNLMPRVIISLMNASFDDKDKKAIENAYQVWCSKANLTAPLIIDAVGADAGTSPFAGEHVGSGAKLQVDSFKDSINEDALFLKGLAEWERSIRASFGFGPIYLGRAEDLTYASAAVHVDLAETQVFAPERTEEDWIYNQIIATWGVSYWKMMTKGCTISNPESAASMLQIALSGGASLNEMRTSMREYLGIDMPEYADPWASFPLLLLKEMASKGALEVVEEGDLFTLKIKEAGAEEVMKDFRSSREAGESLPDWLARMSREAELAYEKVTTKGEEHGDHDQA
jgi:capsid portal protein